MFYGIRPAVVGFIGAAISGIFISSFLISRILSTVSAIVLTSLLQTRVKRVAEAVAQQVEREYRNHDADAGIDCQHSVAAQEAAGIGDHGTPLRHRCFDAKSDKAQTGTGQHGGTHVHRDGNDQRRNGVGDQVFADDTEIVNRINNKTGNVTIGAADVGALPDDTFIPDVYVEKINNKTGVVTLTAADVHALPEDTTIPVVPSVVSAFTNDAGYLTQHQDISNLSLITETGNKISLSIDTVNYVLTLSLLDKNGNALDTKTVDFPLESVVVGGRFDAEKKEIVLTLQSGQSISFPVSDLITGLESTTNKTIKNATQLGRYH